MAKIHSTVLNKRDIRAKLDDAIKDIAPERWGDDAQITLTKGLVCKRHKDFANKEHSWILWFADFTEGALNFDDGTQVEGKRKWHNINGHIHHRSDLREGTSTPSCCTGVPRNQT